MGREDTAQMRRELDELRAERAAERKQKAIEATGRALAPFVAPGLAEDVAHVLHGRQRLVIDEAGVVTLNGLPIEEGAAAWAKSDEAATWRRSARSTPANTPEARFEAKFGTTVEETLGMPGTVARPAPTKAPGETKVEAAYRAKHGVSPLEALWK